MQRQQQSYCQLGWGGIFVGGSVWGSKASKEPSTILPTFSTPIPPYSITSLTHSLSSSSRSSPWNLYDVFVQHLCMLWHSSPPRRARSSGSCKGSITPNLWPWKNWLFTRPFGVRHPWPCGSSSQSQPITDVFDSLSYLGWRANEVGGGLLTIKTPSPCCEGAYVVASAYYCSSVGFLSQHFALTDLGLCASLILALD